MTSDCAILEQELIKYVTQMDFELKEYSQRRIGPTVENIDISTFRKWMTSALNSSASMVEAFELQSQSLESALSSQNANAKAPKQKKRKQKKKQSKIIENDDDFLDAIIAQNVIDKARHDADLDCQRRLEEANKADQLEKERQAKADQLE